MAWALPIAHWAAGARLSPEVASFVLAVVAALGAAWLIALPVVLRIGEWSQRVWVWLITVLGGAAAAGLCVTIVADFVQPPRIVTGLVESLGGAEGARVPEYLVVVDGTPYGVSRADYEKLRIGNRIRAHTGAGFNFLQRVETVP